MIGWVVNPGQATAESLPHIREIAYTPFSRSLRYQREALEKTMGAKPQSDKSERRLSSTKACGIEAMYTMRRNQHIENIEATSAIRAMVRAKQVLSK